MKIWVQKPCLLEFHLCRTISNLDPQIQEIILKRQSSLRRFRKHRYFKKHINGFTVATLEEIVTVFKQSSLPDTVCLK